MCAHADALADEGVSGQREGGEEAVPSICIRRHEDHMHRRQASIGVSIGHEAVTGDGARPSTDRYVACNGDGARPSTDRGDEPRQERLCIWSIGMHMR